MEAASSLFHSFTHHQASLQLSHSSFPSRLASCASPLPHHHHHHQHHQAPEKDDAKPMPGLLRTPSHLRHPRPAKASPHTSQPSTISQVEALLDTIKWDKNGLVVAIAQHIDTGAVLMQGFANRDAIAATLKSHLATFYSRSRATLWTKGETSSNFINVLDIFLDCDRDSIIYLGVPDGPTCHTGAETCYFASAAEFLGSGQLLPTSAITTLYKLEDTIKHKKLEIEKESAMPYFKPSWTKTLLKDKNLLCSKIREEGDELCRSLEDDEGKDRTSSEFADLLYHAMVLLAVQDVKLEEVMKILRARFSQSGVDEKKNRKS